MEDEQSKWASAARRDWLNAQIKLPNSRQAATPGTLEAAGEDAKGKYRICYLHAAGTLLDECRESDDPVLTRCCPMTTYGDLHDGIVRAGAVLQTAHVRCLRFTFKLGAFKGCIKPDSQRCCTCYEMTVGDWSTVECHV